MNHLGVRECGICQLQLDGERQSAVFKRKRGQKEKRRKYCDKYIEYGFSYIEDNNCTKPQCVICGDILSNSSA